MTRRGGGGAEGFEKLPRKTKWGYGKLKIIREDSNREAKNELIGSWRRLFTMTGAAASLKDKSEFLAKWGKQTQICQRGNHHVLGQPSEKRHLFSGRNVEVPCQNGEVAKVKKDIRAHGQEEGSSLKKETFVSLQISPPPQETLWDKIVTQIFLSPDKWPFMNTESEGWENTEITRHEGTSLETI